MKALRTTHGLSYVREYHIWRTIKRRCHNRSDKAYPKYGGSGIYLCDRWQDFNNFMLDMGKMPEGKKSIDRIDNSKGYSPENCRWADWFEQAENRRTTKFLTHRGITQSVSKWGRSTGLRWAIQGRLDAGWSVADAIDTPIMAKFTNHPNTTTK